MKRPEQYLPYVFENSISNYDLRRLTKSVESAQNDGIKSGRAYITDITHRNYEATKRRGLIHDQTLRSDFLRKLYEEVNEFEDSGLKDVSELADIALVCFAMAEHYGIDLIEEMRKKTEFNETRP